MKVWICRDGDGALKMTDQEPDWDEYDDMWICDNNPFYLDYNALPELTCDSGAVEFIAEFDYPANKVYFRLP